MIEFISQLPTEYQEVEYLENSGTQYIVVDFMPNQDTRLDMLVEPRSVVAAESGVGFIPYGSGESYNSKTFECYTNATGKLEFNYDGQLQTDLANVSVGTKINISHNKNNIVVTDTNGQTIASHSFNYTAFTCPRNLTLFAINRSTALVGQTRIYSCQIYNDTTLALALVPCYRKSDNVAGLYDLVNNVFYTNAGSGVFAVGADSNKHAIATIIPGGVISFGAALRRRMMVCSGPFSFEYTGTFTDVINGSNRIITLTSSGILTVKGSITSEVYMLAGGGGAAFAHGYWDIACSGGGGGYDTFTTELKPGDYPITIGTGGAAAKITTAESVSALTGGTGGDTIAFGRTCTGGTGSTTGRTHSVGKGGSPNGENGKRKSVSGPNPMTVLGGAPNGGKLEVIRGSSQQAYSGGDGYITLTIPS